LTPNVDYRFRPAASWTAICHPDESDKTLVRGDGALLYGFRTRTWITYAFDRVIEFGIAGDELPRSVEQRTESAARGIVVTTLRYDQAELTLRAFRHVVDARALDVVLWELRVADDVEELEASLHVEVHDRSKWFSSGPHGASRRVFAFSEPAGAEVDFSYDAHDPGSLEWSPEGVEAVICSLRQPLAVAPAHGFRAVAAFATVPEYVAGGVTVSGALVVPLDGETVAGFDVDAALEHERRYWDGLFPRGIPLQVPDAGIQALLDASARNLLQARELRDGRRVFQVGHTIYRNFWIADSYFMLEAVRYLGLDAAADESLSALEDHVSEDGSIVALGEVGHIKETAIAIATLVRQAELAGDPARLEPWWGRIERAVEHIADLHRSTFALPAGDAARGLMPPAFGDGGVAGTRAEYTTILWALAGLKIVTEAAEHTGRTRAAERFAAVYDELRADFDLHSNAHRRRLPDGHSYLPMVLDGGEHHFRLDAPVVTRGDAIRPETATWALAHAVYPGEVFAPEDEVVAEYLHLLDTVDDREQVPATTGWLPYRALWTYYASFAAHVFLWAGQPEKAIEYLYGFANHAAPTGVWREEQPLRGGGTTAINGDMPHNWASAELIRLVRNLLVFERRDSLQLLPGVPADWLAAGEIRVETPTRFGRVDLRVTPDGTGGRIAYDLKPGLIVPARESLHVPAGRWEVRAGQASREVNGPDLLELASGRT
jgi:hypothetical protein